MNPLTPGATHHGELRDRAGTVIARVEGVVYDAAKDWFIGRLTFVADVSRLKSLLAKLEGLLNDPLVGRLDEVQDEIDAIHLWAHFEGESHFPIVDLCVDADGVAHFTTGYIPPPPPPPEVIERPAFEDPNRWAHREGVERKGTFRDEQGNVIAQIERAQYNEEVDTYFVPEMEISAEYVQLRQLLAALQEQLDLNCGDGKLPDREAWSRQLNEIWWRVDDFNLTAHLDGLRPFSVVALQANDGTGHFKVWNPPRKKNEVTDSLPLGEQKEEMGLKEIRPPSAVVQEFRAGLARTMSSVVDAIAGNSEPTRPPRDYRIGSPRVLVIRRNRMGDMLCTLPLLRALRARNPWARVTVACDEPGAPIVESSRLAERVHIMKRGMNPIHTAFLNAPDLGGYDIVIVTKGGFDTLAALLARLTHAPIRIGYDDNAPLSAFYTHPLPPPPWNEHQIDSTLALLAPLEIGGRFDWLSFSLPASSLVFAEEVWKVRDLASAKVVGLVNISSTTPIKWTDEEWAEFFHRLVVKDGATIGVIFAPADRAKAEAWAKRFDTPRLFAQPTVTVLDLAALIARAGFVFTPEGGVGHLTAAMGTPAVVLWSEGPYEKWRPRNPRQKIFRFDPLGARVPVEEVLHHIRREYIPQRTVRGVSVSTNTARVALA